MACPPCERKNKCVCLYKLTGSAINHAVLLSPGRTSPPKDISSTPLGGGGKFHKILFYCFFIVILFKKLLEVYSFALYQDLVHLLLTVYFQQSSSSFAWKEEAVGRGVLPYINYTGLCRSTGSWFWSFLFRTGYPFQRRFLERGITFRTHESSSFVSSDLKLFKDRLLLRIRFNALTSKLLHSCCTLERSIKNWPISRTGYQF